MTSYGEKFESIRLTWGCGARLNTTRYFLAISTYFWRVDGLMDLVPVPTKSHEKYHSTSRCPRRRTDRRRC
ncbi:hypothetical protein L596_030880 [Steinernema carpocapsae]|uniref:Uncharacterized protein n=1 Tax=Steinernema carpocapsae TaxID=34508 RepID=A0A4U5LNE9_STECR|nr:hypothetical protein L596_030880 [Steinernema carpocapsae]